MTNSIQEIAMKFYRERSERNFATLYNRLLPGLRTYARNIVKDWDVVDEMVAVTLTKAYSLIDLYEEKKGAFSTWVYRICRNECLCELKRANKLASLDLLMEIGTPIKAINKESIQFEASFDYITHSKKEPTHEDYMEAVLEELAKLPERMRDPYEDFTFRKLKYEQIAALRGIPSNTVRTRIFNARNTIRKNVEKKFAHDEGESI